MWTWMPWQWENVSNKNKWVAKKKKKQRFSTTKQKESHNIKNKKELNIDWEVVLDDVNMESMLYVNGECK